MTMQTDTTQRDLYRDSQQRQAQQWREAAEASLRQFPTDTARHDYYVAEAQRLEAQTA